MGAASAAIVIAILTADRPTDPRRPLLSVRGLACRRGERPLFAPIGFDLAAGQAIWLRGANGQGKTTLLRTLAGLSPVETGSAVQAGSSTATRAALYLGHANALKEDLDAGEALAFLLALDGVGSDAASVEGALRALGVHAQRRARMRTLSQGQRRRVALARLAVADQPPIWLLDEPFDALDAGGVDAAAALLATHLDGGGAALLTSHVPLPPVIAARVRTIELEPAR